MLAEPHDMRSLAEFSLNPIDRGACRKASRSVVREQYYQHRRTFTDEPVQGRGVGEDCFTMAQDGHYGDKKNAKERHKRQASRTRQPKVGRHRACREDEKHEKEVRVPVDEPQVVNPPRLNSQCCK